MTGISQYSRQLYSVTTRAYNEAVARGDTGAARRLAGANLLRAQAYDRADGGYTLEVQRWAARAGDAVAA